MNLWSEISLQWSSLVPAWLSAALLLALVVALGWGTALLTRRGVARKFVVWLGLIRMACIAVAALILLQPTFTSARQEAELPEMIVLVDRSASMGLPSGNSGQSRWQQTKAWLQQGDLAKNLSERFHLRWFAFDEAAVPLKDGALNQETPTGQGTRLGESLEAAWLHQQALGRPAPRVLLASDGVDHGLSDPARVARRLGAKVDTLIPTAGAAKTDDVLAIADVQGARRVLLGSETHFRLTLRRSRPAAADQKIAVRFVENQKPAWDRLLTMPAKATEHTFFLAHRPETGGLKTCTFQIMPGGDKTGPSVERTLDVVDKNQEVLVLEDSWRWEFKHLLRLLEDDPSFRFTALLSRGGGAFVQFGSPDRRVNLVGFPQNQGDLERFDIFFLGDVNPSRWTPGVAAALARQVQDEGKSLVVIGGPNLANLGSMPDLEKLLPVEVNGDSGKPVEGPIEARLRPEASVSPFFFQLRSGESLPPLDRVYPVVRKRAGATVLLEATGQRNAFGNLILMAEHRAGKGRVLFLGSDTLWKWHTLAPVAEGPTPYAIFWQQALRALAPLRGGPQDVQLWLSTQRSRVDVGQPLILEAEIHAQRPLPGAQVKAVLALPDGKRLPVVFSSDAADPKRFRAEMASPVAGQVTLIAQLMVNDKVEAEGTLGVQVESSRPETSDVEVDTLGMSRLAQGTGGQVVDPARPETWPQPDEQGTTLVKRTRTVDLWNNFTLLLILAGLLAIDWFLRLTKGLV